MGTIKELFYGNIHPFERDVPKDIEGDKIAKLTIRHETALKATLNENEAKILEKYKDAMTELSCLSECGGFINGFRLGVRLMTESFYGRENKSPGSVLCAVGRFYRKCRRSKFAMLIKDNPKKSSFEKYVFKIRHLCPKL